MSERASKRRSVRQLAGRKRSIYFEPDTDDDIDLERDGDGADDYQPEPVRQQALPLRKKKKAERRSTKRQTRSKTKTRSHFGNRGARLQEEAPIRRVVSTLGKKLKHREVKPVGFTGPSDAKIPAWTSLPLEVVRDIFIYASQPRHEQTTTASANVTWLLRAARTCRSLTVPALEAYYQSPYPLANLQPHHLLELLRLPKEKTYIDYSVKVKSLEIEVKRLAYAATGRSLFDLTTLILALPQLQHLEIVHPVDTPPYRPMKFQRWTYPSNLFDAFEDSRKRLKSWRWSRDMIPPTMLGDLYGQMTQIHGGKSFEYLERLVVCGFDVADSAEPPTSQDENVPRLPGLASAISVLPRLKNLSFISCDLVMEEFLQRIPKGLERLELSNCLEVTSDMMQKYLVTGGSHLRELVLNHNAALNLSFLTSLKTVCPRLEVLKMDLTYYSERFTFNDAWAMYEEVLSNDEVPMWPSTLRHLELVNLQKWEAEAAQNLFRSLVEGASELPDLRHLVLQAHINIPWRDRAGFRDQWIERLQRVFLRKSEDPDPHLGSFRQYRIWKETVARKETQIRAEEVANTKAEAKARAKADIRAKQRAVLGIQDDPVSTSAFESDDDAPVLRRLSHVRVTPRKKPTGIDTFSDSEPQPTKRRGTRPRRSARVADSQSAASPPADEPSSESEPEPADDWRRLPERFIHGLCEVVDIRIDNQRPRENQYTEANFLDSEPSGDEDWHSGAELSDDGYAS